MLRYLRYKKRKSKNLPLVWDKASDIGQIVEKLTKGLGLDYINLNSIYCFRSKNSNARAYARIWGLNRIWQQAIHSEPKYIIEVLSEKFDSLKESEKEKVLIHELAHIPKNFSGSLIPHIRKLGSRNFNSKVRKLITQREK